MKNHVSASKRVLALILAIMTVISLISCSPEVDPPEANGGLWENATYSEDTTLGNGAKTVRIVIKAEEKSVTLTVKTDGATLSDALTEHSLVNDPSFFDTANGIKADYSANESWWKVCKDGTATPKGIAETPIADGEQYEIIYTIGY